MLDISWWWNFINIFGASTNYDGDSDSSQPSYMDLVFENVTFAGFKYYLTLVDFRFFYNVVSILLISLSSIFFSSITLFIYFKYFYPNFLKEVQSQLDRLENLFNANTNKNAVDENLEEGKVNESDPENEIGTVSIQYQESNADAGEDQSLQMTNDTIQIQDNQLSHNSLMNEKYLTTTDISDNSYMNFDETPHIPKTQVVDSNKDEDEESFHLNSTPKEDQPCSSSSDEMNKIPLSPLTLDSEDSEDKCSSKMENESRINETFQVFESFFAGIENKSTHSEDFGDVDLILYQYPRGQRIPCLSSSGLRIETILRMAEIKYNVITSDAEVKNFPCLKLPDNNKRVYGFQECLRLINTTFVKKIQKFKLSENQRRKILYFAKILDDRLNSGLYLWRSLFEENMEIMNNGKIWSNELCEDGLDSNVVQRFIRKSLGLENGFGKEDLIKVLNADLKNVSDLLGKNQFFCGKKITEVDCLVFSTLTQFSVGDLSLTGGDSETKIFIQDNLEQFCVRVQKLLWSDWKWIEEEGDVLFECEVIKTPASSSRYGLRTPKSVNGQDDGKLDSTQLSSAKSASSRRRRYSQSIDAKQTPVRRNTKTKDPKSKLQLTPVSPK